MQVTLELPEDLIYSFGGSSVILSRAALEALVLEGLRTGKFTVVQSRRLLGISSRYEMDGFLKAKGIFLNLSAEDVKRDAEVALSFRTE